MIRNMIESDIEYCAEILCSVYNNTLWQCRWSLNTAKEYLHDYFESKKFVGFTLEIEGNVCGAMFCHEKIWWNNSELLIDEMFVQPQLQGKGYGSKLIDTATNYVKEHKLAGFTLSTNRYASALQFYKKNGFIECEHILFMCKEIE